MSGTMRWGDVGHNAVGWRLGSALLFLFNFVSTLRTHARCCGHVTLVQSVVHGETHTRLDDAHPSVLIKNCWMDTVHIKNVFVIEKGSS